MNQELIKVYLTWKMAPNPADIVKEHFFFKFINNPKLLLIHKVLNILVFMVELVKAVAPHKRCVDLECQGLYEVGHRTQRG